MLLKDSISLVIFCLSTIESELWKSPIIIVKFSIAPLDFFQLFPHVIWSDIVMIICGYNYICRMNLLFYLYKIPVFISSKIISCLKVYFVLY